LCQGSIRSCPVAAIPRNYRVLQRAMPSNACAGELPQLVDHNRQRYDRNAYQYQNNWTAKLCHLAQRF
jgi:hypothetical protein